LKRISSFLNSLRNDRCALILCIMCTALFLLLMCLLSLAIIQSDDYFYAHCWRGGLLNFIKFTGEHFMTFNGRAAVHVVVQSVLSMPTFVYPLVASAILLASAILSALLFLPSPREKKELAFFVALFYILIMLSGRDTIKEALMWKSAFFNYVMPSVFLLSSLLCFKKHYVLSLFFALLSGASTEQWGIASVVFFTLIAISDRNDKKRILHVPLAIFGSATVFLSPATQLRVETSGRFSPEGLYNGYLSLSRVFVNKDAAFMIMLFFIAVTIPFALREKKLRFLLFGAAPAALIMLSPFVPTAPAAFLSFLIYMAIVVFVFWSTDFKLLSFSSAAAFFAVIAVIPTGTYENRITFPVLFFLIVSIVLLCCRFSFSCRHTPAFIATS